MWIGDRRETDEVYIHYTNKHKKVPPPINKKAKTITKLTFKRVPDIPNLKVVFLVVPAHTENKGPVRAG